MSRVVLALYSSLTALSFLVTGCSTKGTPNTSTNHGTPKPVVPTQTTPQDGKIISMKLVNNPNSGLNIYRMFYWSQGYKVEAYVTEPKNPGSNQYPLLVDCHGGYIDPTSELHVSAFRPTDGHSGKEELWAALSQASASRVTLFPMYRGYEDSQGQVQGLLGDTIDTENAITAADSLRVVNDRSVSLLGSSMGGGVVLMIDSNPKYAPFLTSVIAVSPFVGWDIAGQWAEKNRQNKRAKEFLIAAQTHYGLFDPRAKVFRDRSPDPQNMDTPTLLLQGTADQSTPWQTVQMLYQQMKKANDPVTLDLVPGGNHGLVGKYQKTTYEDMTKWVQSNR